MEAHAFWLKTVDYDEIVASKMHQRGKKTVCWHIPAALFKGPPDATGCITIQMAFRRPDWTLIFADHNSMITFHIMHVKRHCAAVDFQPGSQVSVYLFALKFPLTFISVDLEAHLECHSWSSFNSGA